MKCYSTVLSVLLLLALPCAGHAAVPPTTPDAPAQSPSLESEDSVARGAHAKMTAAADSAKQAGSVDLNPTGKVIETMNGGGYTYARLARGGKKTWVAFPTLDTRVGDTLSFHRCLEMSAFQSRSLKRRFDSILFCGSPEVKPAAAAAGTTVALGKMPQGSAGAATAGGKVAVEKASGPNAYTVSELFAKRDVLSGKQVTVRGKVVLVSAGIMKTNWIHLQDGTGSGEGKTDDLVVTSSDLPKVGDVVTVSGTLQKNRDFGGGYRYSTIIEKGSVRK